MFKLSDLGKAYVRCLQDNLIENKVNGKRYRLDKLIEEFSNNKIKVEKMNLKEMETYVQQNIKT